MRFSDDSVMRLYRQTVEDFGLFPGMELSDGEMEKLRTAAGEMSAKMRAVRIVSASSVSEGDLKQRLIRKGEDPVQADQAVAWMSDMGLVDDEKTAQMVVEHCIAKGYGVNRAKQALYEKRIPKQYWQDALADYPDQFDAIVNYLAGHLGDGTDPKLLRRTVDALMRRGHSYGVIRRALDTMRIGDDGIPEEQYD